MVVISSEWKLTSDCQTCPKFRKKSFSGKRLKWGCDTAISRRVGRAVECGGLENR
jgi:hypothetical protein